MKNKFARIITRWKTSIAILLALLLPTLLVATPAYADSVVVTDCSNESQLFGFISGAPPSGRTITFSCGTATITFTFVNTIGQNITIDGGGVITLSTNGSTHHFQVFSGKTFTLQNITLANGKDSVTGSIENFGTTIIDNSTFANNQSTARAGAIFNHGVLTITNSTFSNNQAATGGGAIYNDGTSVTVTGSQFLNNKNTSLTGGAIALTNGGILTVTSTTFNNNSGFDGGAVYVDPTASATISASTVISNAANYGAGIESFGTLTVTDSTITQNKAVNDGGGVWNVSGIATLTNDTVSFNSGSQGGGISNYDTLVLTNSTINNNTSTASGGGVLSSGNATLTSSTINNNISTDNGGGIFSGGTITLRNVTLSANQATGSGKLGGGLFQNGTSAALTFVTFVGNSASAGGGLNNNPGTMNLQNVLLSNNPGGNCAGSYTSLGHNLSDDNFCGNFTQPGDKKNTPALLGPLANNSGPTFTHLPSASSPAVEGGQCVGGIATDQRGVTRPQGTFCDIGSVERRPLEPSLFLPLILR